MWQEARKQEKKLRCIMIDYKKRAERRQAYYARMRMDPHQLMRVYGQKCKFHLAAENTKTTSTDGQLMPWQGDPEILIDRFDVRAHLDLIPNNTVIEDNIEITSEEEKFKRKCNYERYRTLVQVDATGASEEQYLKQLELEEGVGRADIENKRRIENDKLTSKANAKFHYKYEESSETLEKEDDSTSDDESNSDSCDDDLSDIDINVNVLDLTEEQTNHLDALATQYGVGYGQYCKQLLLEKKEFEYVKKLEEEEEERAKMPGRKGKSARRTLREKQKTLRGSPLSFALQETPAPEEDEHTKREGSTSSESSTHSKTPVESKVEFITSFGGDDENSKNGSENILPATEPQKKSRERSNSHRKHSRHRSRSRSQGKSSSSNDHKSRDRHKSKSRSDRKHRRSHHSSSKPHERSKNSHSRHSSHSSRNNERSISSHSHTHGSRSRSPKNYMTHESISKSPKRKDEGYTRKDSNEKLRDSSRSKSLSKSNIDSKESSRRISDSRSRSKSRSKSPHGTIVKRLGTDNIQTPVIDKSNLTPREKMKIRMQKLLNRQIKSDKKEEHKKQVAKEQEIEERDMEIYEMSRMLRMKEREKRIYRSPSPKGAKPIPSYDASRFKYVRSKGDSPE